MWRRRSATPGRGTCDRSRIRSKSSRASNSPWLANSCATTLGLLPVRRDRPRPHAPRLLEPPRPRHVLTSPTAPSRTTIRDYYRYLDEELGSLLELLTDDTVVLVVSDHGAQRLDGGFCVNEWLIREGRLVLNSYPERSPPFGKLDVTGRRTRVWSEGGYYARVFFNVKGREPQGVIEPADYDRFRDEVKARLEATTDAGGPTARDARLQARGDLSSDVRNVAPDLIVHFGAPRLALDRRGRLPDAPRHENDTGPDDCNHAQHGAFILAVVEQSRCGARSKGRTCWTSPRRSWSWADTTSPTR